MSFAGKTDPQIAYELLGHTEIPRSVVKARLEDLWTRYLKHFDNELVSSLVRPFPGVVECLNHVESKAGQALMGLLTGNIDPGAQRKLDASGLGFSRFQVGAFGSDSENRDELPMIAAARAKALVGEHPEYETLVIVGDTSSRKHWYPLRSCYRSSHAPGTTTCTDLGKARRGRPVRYSRKLR